MLFFFSFKSLFFLDYYPSTSRACLPGAIGGETERERLSPQDYQRFRPECTPQHTPLLLTLSLSLTPAPSSYSI